jgi:GT2 family glycosyltransferase
MLQSQQKAGPTRASDWSPRNPMAQTLTEQPRFPLLQPSHRRRTPRLEASPRYRATALADRPDVFLCHRRGAALALQQPNQKSFRSGWVQLQIVLEFADHLPLRFRVACEGAGTQRLTPPIALESGWRGPKVFTGTVHIAANTKVLLLFVDLPHDSKLRLRDVKLRGISSARALLQTAWYALQRQPISIARLQRATEKLVGALVQGGISGTALEMLPWGSRGVDDTNYTAWIDEYEKLLPQDVARIKAQIAAMPRPPRFSVVMPTYNSMPMLLRQAVASVQQQLYPHWELCIADDASPDKGVVGVLKELQQSDSRIKLKLRRTNGHISLASNSALEMVENDWVVLLDHDDKLSPMALYHAATEILAHPDAGVLYSDEDKIDMRGIRQGPYFKPDFDPDLLHGQNMISHLGIYRTDLVRRLGGFRKGYEGSQDHDLALRVTEQLRPDQIRHLPHVLYHWRIVEGSASGDTDAKPYARLHGAQAVRDQLQRRGSKATVHIDADSCTYRVTHPLPEALPPVHIIIPTRDRIDLLQRCIQTVQQTTPYPNWHIVVVDNQSRKPESLAYFNRLRSSGAADVVSYAKPFNFSAVCNRGAAHLPAGLDALPSDGLLCFLNNDIEAFEAGWLEAMVRQALRPEVGMVGAKLLYPDGRVQHGGILCGVGGIAAHAHLNDHMNARGYFDRGIIACQFSAVTGACMVLRRSVFEEVGGFDESLPVAYNDLDLCLRIREAGYAVMFEPNARLIHHESASRGSDASGDKRARLEQDSIKIRARWQHRLEFDPFYNPNLTLQSGNFMLDTPRHQGYRESSSGLSA